MYSNIHTYSRYSIPTAESFREPIIEDEFDLSMAKTDSERQLSTDARASKLWRTLRVASKSKLNLFDRIDDGNNLQALFQPDGDENKSKGDSSGLDLQGKDNTPIDSEPVQPSESAIEILEETAV